jgi:hypothetical protein
MPRRRIIVDLSDRHLYLLEDNRVVRGFLVGIGKILDGVVQAGIRDSRDEQPGVHRQEGLQGLHPDVQRRRAATRESGAHWHARDDSGMRRHSLRRVSFVCPWVNGCDRRMFLKVGTVPSVHHQWICTDNPLMLSSLRIKGELSKPSVLLGGQIVAHTVQQLESPQRASFHQTRGEHCDYTCTLHAVCWTARRRSHEGWCNSPRNSAFRNR